MNTLTENFLEDPTYVFVLLAAVEVVLVLMWRARRTKRLLQLLVLPVAVGGVVFAIDALVVTDREQIQQASGEIATDLEKGRLDAASRYLDDNYFGFTGTKTLLMKYAQNQIDRLKITKINLSYKKIQVTGKMAEMDVTSVIHTEGDFAGTYPLKWKVRWVKRPQGWRIEEVSEPKQTVPGFN